MFRIRPVSDSITPGNARAIGEVQAMIAAQFPGMPEADRRKLPDQIANPIRHEFIADLAVAEGRKGTVRGFSLVLRDEDLKFGYLELISAAPGGTGQGLGAALYERLRDRAKARGLHGLYFECLPDEARLSPDPVTRSQNAARLRFYERYGARPITGTAYETPVNPADTDPPYLVFDGLDTHRLPGAKALRKIVRAILERKYKDHCPPDYVDRVAGSIRDETCRLREPRYGIRTRPEPTAQATPPGERFALIVNADHDIHHVLERGYVESPVRISSILDELDRTGLFETHPARHFADSHIRAVHDDGLVNYIEKACAEAPEGRSTYPYVFPIRNAARSPKDSSVLAGYWCIDTFTPLNHNAYPAARGAVDCALTAAAIVARGARAAYALVRPPGHHAESRAFGGFCYFNNGAIAANWLARGGRRVAMLDLDYHHGNGQQDIFYERSDVLTISVHGDPSFAYPYFSGFADETGRGAGKGFNLNLPLAETASPDDHRAAVTQAIDRILAHQADFLVVPLGLDTAKGDPTGSWSNRAGDFDRLGALVASIGLPTVFVQEGGYKVRSLGISARHFFCGFAKAARTLPVRAPVAPDAEAALPAEAAPAITWRIALKPSDPIAVRELVAATAVFSEAELEIAQELASDALAKGQEASGYHFILADIDGQLAGYACYGEIAGTEGSYDLYWIATSPGHRGIGLGAALVERTQTAIRTRGGRAFYAETSGTPAYAEARAFYLRTGFTEVSTIADFYRPGDAKVTYRRKVA